MYFMRIGNLEKAFIFASKSFVYSPHVNREPVSSNTRDKQFNTARLHFKY